MKAYSIYLITFTLTPPTVCLSTLAIVLSGSRSFFLTVTHSYSHSFFPGVTRSLVHTLFLWFFLLAPAMAPSMRWLSLALWAPLALAVKPPPSPPDVVTCTDVPVSENLFSNPSWEDGKHGWEYNFGAVTTNEFASDGSYSVYGHPGRVEGGAEFA